MKTRLCIYDEAFTIKEMLEETNMCVKCGIAKCSYHGKTKANSDKDKFRNNKRGER